MSQPVASTPIDFGTSCVPVERNITIDNVGSGWFTVLPPTISDCNAFTASVTRNTTQVAAGTSISMTVVFTPPNSANQQNGTLNVWSSDPNVGMAHFALSGTTGIKLVAQPASTVAFGSPLSAIDKNITIISNVGSAPLTLSIASPNISGSATFALITPPSTSVPVGGSSVATIRFTAPLGSPLPQVGVFALSTNDPSMSVVRFTLTGLAPATVFQAVPQPNAV